MRVRVYIDGFNLYNRMLKRDFPQYKWLDPHKLACRLSPTREVDQTLYFTARVKGFGGRDQSVLNQQIYLRAVSQNPSITIHYGQFTRHPKFMRRAEEGHSEPYVKVWRSEEKGSDVNLASYLLADAFQDRMDMAILVSNDSDFAEAITIAREEAQKTVLVYSPQHNKISKKLREVSDGIFPVRASYLKKSSLPKKISTKHKPLTMPRDWTECRNDMAAWIRALRVIGSAHI